MSMYMYVTSTGMCTYMHALMSCFLYTCSAVDPSVPSWTPEEVYDEVVSVSQALRARQSLFRVWDDWRDKLAQWRGLPITALSMAELHKDVNTLISQVDYLEKGTSVLLRAVCEFPPRALIGSGTSWGFQFP